EQLIGLDHLLQPRFVAAVSAIAVGMILADQLRIAAAQLGAVGLAAQPHHAQGLALERGKAGIILPSPRLPFRACPDLRRPRPDSVERVIEVGPARHAVYPRIGTESASVVAPAGNRRLRLAN